jgi:hypothetical protein
MSMHLYRDNIRKFVGVFTITEAFRQTASGNPSAIIHPAESAAHRNTPLRTGEGCIERKGVEQVPDFRRPAKRI